MYKLICSTKKKKKKEKAYISFNKIKFIEESKKKKKSEIIFPYLLRIMWLK